jgi:transcriptional regulator with XRE-family HTH domain
LSFVLRAPGEVSQELADRVRDLRLRLNLTQEGLAQRAGLSTGTVKRFEKIGQISLVSFLQISQVLGELENFDKLFQSRASLPASIEDIINQPEKPKRGRLK